MADDRQLRDELEKVQSEVLRLKKALANPAELLTGQRARVDALRRSKAQQEEKLKDARSEAALLQAQLNDLVHQNQGLQRELDALLTTERGLVGAAVRHLDPGPSRAGCTTLAVLLAVVVCLIGAATRSGSTARERGPHVEVRR